MGVEAQRLIENSVHYAVLLQETVSMLQPKAYGKYLDGTVGLGGHSFSLLEAAGCGAELCGIDQDMNALEIAKVKLEPFGENVHLVHSKYSNFASAMDLLGWEYLDGAIIDIGVSSLQLDLSSRGFSFLHDGPLDMRMDQSSQSVSAAELVNKSKEEILQKIIAEYGEDPQAYRIAKAIIAARNVKTIETTKELAGIVEQAYPVSWRFKARNHPATRTFQALRIAVNNEFDELKSFLDTILSRIAPGGRLAVISFHSLEDRIVKQRMKAWAQSCICPISEPVCICNHKQEAKIVTTKPICPSEEEVLENIRSRSAKLRVVEKCKLGERTKFSSKDLYEEKKLRKAFMNKKG